jgi:uncharacterized repeat protein (TIGR03803 family)
VKQACFKRWWRTHCNKLPGARVAALSSLLSLVAFQGKGQTYSVVHHFPNSLGSWDGVTLVASGTMLYGTTWNGGSSNQGTLFKVDTSSLSN